MLKPKDNVILALKITEKKGEYLYEVYKKKFYFMIKENFAQNLWVFPDSELILIE